MKMKLKALSLAAVSSALIFTSACSDKEASKEAEKVDASSLPEAGDFSKELELNLSGSVTRGKVEDGNYVQKRLEEQFNIKIQNTKVDTWNKDQVNLMIASGDLPDTFSLTGQPKTAKELYDGGLVRTIPKEMLEK